MSRSGLHGGRSSGGPDVQLPKSQSRIVGRSRFRNGFNKTNGRRRTNALADGAKGGREV